MTIFQKMYNVLFSRFLSYILYFLSTYFSDNHTGPSYRFTIKTKM